MFSEEHKMNISKSRIEGIKDGRIEVISWKKGLNKENDERVRIQAEKTSKTLKNLYKEGKIQAWNKGLTKETDERIRIQGEKTSKIKKMMYKEGKLKPIRWWKGKNNPKISETLKRLYKEGKIKNSMKGKCHSKEIIDEFCRKARTPERIKISIQNLSKIDSKKNWQNPEFMEKTIKAQLKGLFKRPTSLENKFIKIIKRKNLPYKYVGDGSFLIGYKNPDFINTNGLKRCIEIRPKKMVSIWSRGKETPEDYVTKRTEHFAKYGWNCQVIWQEDFKNKIENIFDS